MSKYIAGFNDAGYLPDDTPVACESFTEAKEYLIDVLGDLAENATNSNSPHIAREFREARNAIRKARRHEVPLNAPAEGKSFWIDFAIDE